MRKTTITFRFHPQTMHDQQRRDRRRLASGIGVTAGVFFAAAVQAASPPAAAPPQTVHLTSGDGAQSSLGDGAAFVMGGTSIPIPGQRAVDAADGLYLAPDGFDGDAEALFTPEGLSPLTGVKSLPLDESENQGVQIIVDTVLGQLADEDADADNPAVFFGYSQSAGLAGLAMPELAEHDVPADAVHFMLVGDNSVPNGGLLSRFDVPEGANPTIPSLGVTFSGAEPTEQYPADVYTIEYDGFADFPEYPINLLADLNALLGIGFEHLTYEDVAPDRIEDAIDLPTSADSLVDYHMIPADDLPLVDPIRLVPVLGDPLADLLEPDLKVLVNLGYGDIDEGWSHGNADDPTPFGLFPDLEVLRDVPEALADGLQQGVGDALDDLQDPDTYQLSPEAIFEEPVMQRLVDGEYTFDLVDTPDPSPQEILGGIATLLSPDTTSQTSTPSSSLTEIVNELGHAASTLYQPLLAIADTATTLSVTLPEYDADIAVGDLEDGDLLGAVGDPIAANTGLIPTALAIGVAAPIASAISTLAEDFGG